MGGGSQPLEAKEESPLTLLELASKIEAERCTWSTSIKDIREQQVQTLKVLTESLDLAMVRIGSLEQRIGPDYEHVGDCSNGGQQQLARASKVADSRHVPSAEAFGSLCKDIDILKDQHIATSTEIVALRSEQGAGIQEVQLLVDEMRAHIAEAIRGRSKREDLDVVPTGPTDAEFEALRDSLLRHRDEIDALRHQQANALEALESHHGRFIEDLRMQQEELAHEIVAVRNQCSESAASHGQVMSEFGKIRAQFIESIKALQLQHGQQSSMIEALRTEQHRSIEAMRGQTLEIVESRQGMNGASVERLVDGLRSQHAHELSALQCEASRQNAEMTTVRDGLQALQELHIEELQALRGQQSSGLEEIRQEHATLVAILKEQQESLQAQVTSVQAGIAASMKKEADTSASMTKQFEVLAGELEKLWADNCSNSSQRLSDLEVTTRQLHDGAAELRRLQSCSSQTVDAMQTKQDACTEVVRSQETAQAQLLSELAAIKRQLSDSTKAWQGLRGKHSGDLEALKEQHATGVRMMQDQHSKLQDQHKEVRELLLEQATKLQAQENLHSQITTYRSDIKEELADHGHVIEKLRQQLHNLHTQYDEVSHTVEAFGSDCTRRRELENTVTRIESELAIMQQHQDGGLLACFTQKFVR